MKSFVVFALCVAVALAAPPSSYNGDPKLAEVIRNDNNNIGVEGFQAAYETSNGISENKEGQLTNPGTDDEAYVLRGSYSYTAPDGQVISVTYIADANGFQPQGAHIPK